MTATQVKVEKNNNENTTSLIRRFTKKVQGSGLVQKVRSIRFRSRPSSTLKTKREALKRIENIKNRERLVKLGKLPENRYGRR